MSYLIDTNVLSELRRKQPDANVMAWFERRSRQSLYLSVLTLGEIRKGIERLSEPAGSLRHQALVDWLDRVNGRPETATRTHRRRGPTPLHTTASFLTNVAFLLGVRVAVKANAVELTVAVVVVVAPITTIASSTLRVNNVG